MTYNREKTPAHHAFNFASDKKCAARTLSQIRKEFVKIDIRHKTKACHVNLYPESSLHSARNWLNSGRAIALPISRD